MNIEVFNGNITEMLCDTLILGVADEALVPSGTVAEVDRALDGQITAILRDQPWRSKYGKTTILYPWQRLGAKQIILLGLGKEKELTNDAVRALAGTALRVARDIRSSTVVMVTHGLSNIQAVVEGTLLGNYQFTSYKTDKTDHHVVEKIFLFASNADGNLVAQAIQKGSIIAESVNFARDMVNHPANVLTPSRIAEEASRIARSHGMELTVLEQQDMQNLSMHAVLAVAQGSNQAPKLVTLKYIGSPSDKEIIAFVGKGITFDSGGISLKPSEGMQDMKDDMAGAAAMLGAITAIGRLKLAVNVIAVLPCAENMPSGMAIKPGDVISSMEGKTIEVVNTDAEGRLVLADGLTYARQLGATKLIDMATLTGACVVALGNVTSGVFTNNDEWCDTVLSAAKGAGEKMWKLPSFDDYKEQIESSIADLKNSGGRSAGAITAALFLANFTGNLPWVHIDIAGTVTSDKDKGYQVKGATGVGVRTLVKLAENLASKHDS